MGVTGYAALKIVRMNETLKILMQCHLQKKNPISNNETYLWTLDEIYTHVYYHYKKTVINLM